MVWGKAAAFHDPSPPSGRGTICYGRGTGGRRLGSVVVEWREARALLPRRDRILIDEPSGVVDPIEIAWIEFNSGAIPIIVKRET